MKTIIKYISLLLYSGLIIPFYYHNLPEKAEPTGQKVKAAVIKYKATRQKARKRISLINDAVAGMLPVLKNLQ